MNVAQEVNLLIERCPPEQYGELANELGRALIKIMPSLTGGNQNNAQRMTHDLCEDLYRAARVR